MEKFLSRLLFILFSICIIGCTTGDPYEGSPAETKIVSLDRSAGAYGTFSLGFGSADTYPHYLAYEKVGKDKYVLLTIPAVGPKSFKTEVIESGLNKLVEIPMQRGIFFLGINSFQCMTIGLPSVYEIHVPKGSIVKEFRP